MICRCHLGFSGNAMGVDMVSSLSWFPFSQIYQWEQQRYDLDV